MVNFKKILGTFVELNEEDTNTSTHPNPQKTSFSTPSGTPISYQDIPERGQNPTPASVHPANLEEIEKRLNKVIEEENRKNFPGADYYEFELALENMKDVPVESARYVSAFNVLSATQGLTRDHLIETAQAYIKIVDREMNEFNAGYEKEAKEQVEDKKLGIEAKSLQMQALSQQISSLNEEIKKMNQELVENKNRLESAKNSFLNVAQSHKQKISAELEKIQSYIH